MNNTEAHSLMAAYVFETHGAGPDISKITLLEEYEDERGGTAYIRMYAVVIRGGQVVDQWHVYELATQVIDIEDKPHHLAPHYTINKAADNVNGSGEYNWVALL